MTSTFDNVAKADIFLADESRKPNTVRLTFTMLGCPIAAFCFLSH
jgi:hypothetical protein